MGWNMQRICNCRSTSHALRFQCLFPTVFIYINCSWAPPFTLLHSEGNQQHTTWSPHYIQYEMARFLSIMHKVIYHMWYQHSHAHIIDLKMRQCLWILAAHAVFRIHVGWWIWVPFSLFTFWKTSASICLDKQKAYGCRIVSRNISLHMCLCQHILVRNWCNVNVHCKNKSFLCTCWLCFSFNFIPQHNLSCDLRPWLWQFVMTWCT